MTLQHDLSPGRALTHGPDASGTSEMHAHKRNLHLSLVRLSGIT